MTPTERAAYDAWASAGEERDERDDEGDPMDHDAPTPDDGPNIIDLAARRQAIPTLGATLTPAGRSLVADCVEEIVSLLGGGTVPSYAITPAGPGRARLTLEVAFDVGDVNAYAARVKSVAAQSLTGVDTYNALTDAWQTTAEVAARVGLDASDATRALERLFALGEVQRVGDTWRRA